MMINKMFNYIIILVIFFLNCLLAQDSLYLIGTITGENVYNPIYSAKGLYDVNGDGFDDFLLSGFIDDNGFWSGKVYLYFGRQEIDTIPDFSFRDVYLQDLLGAGSGGDINGDEYNDFTIANPYNWDNGRGRVYLFLGGETIVDTPFVTFLSDSIEDFYGCSTSLEGDINGDGFNDLLIGAPYLAGGQNINPKCYVYFGGNPFDENNYLEFSSSEEMDSFGKTAGNAGDINNDGYDDLIIGATNHRNEDEVMVGKAYVFLGSAEPDTIPDFTMEGETKWSHFGWKVGSCGDLNGDGYDEIYILADLYPDNENPLGKIYIYSMKKFIVGVEEQKNTLPDKFLLKQNYPNPFNPSTNIKFSLPNPEHIEMEVYNIIGQRIETLLNKPMPAGYHEVEFNGSHLSSGVYFYRIEAGEFQDVKKMVLLR